MIDLPPQFLLGIILVWLFIMGAVIGSFLNVCVYRIPQHDRLADQLRGLVSPGSHCPRCQTPIQKSDNIPIIGWLRLGGRCRSCGSRISFRYPLIECLNGALFVLVYWLELPKEFATYVEDSCTWSPLGPHLVEGWSDSTMLHFRYFYHMILVEALLVASLIDWDTMTIPDGSTVPAMIAGIVLTFGLGQMYLVPVWFQDPHLASYIPISLDPLLGEMTTMQRTFPQGVPSYGRWFEFPAWVITAPHLHGLAASVVGFLVGGGLVWGVRLAGFWTLKREAMGFGDVILMALIGSFLGWQPTLVAFFVAPFLAMVVTIVRGIIRLVSPSEKQGSYIPYGPYLSLAAVIVLLGWKWLWPIVGRWFSAGPFVPILGIVLLALMVPTLMFVQLIKRMLGIPLYPDELYEEVWTSADTLTFLAGEMVERDRQSWSNTSDWPGTASANGTIHQERWQNRDHATGWTDL